MTSTAKLTQPDGSIETPLDCPYKIREVKTIFHGCWMGAKQVDFVDPATNNNGVGAIWLNYILFFTSSFIFLFSSF